MSDDDSDELDIEYVRRFLVRFPNTRTIIVNGGDPLMVKPEYYWNIISILDELGLKDTTISLTTNLWPFYKKPEMWEELFKHPRVGVATSFQYGDARLKGDYTPYTEEEFWKVSNLFLERIGYRPSFIAVITNENEDTVLKTVELAKAMGVVCKVNYAVASGPKKTTFKGITIGNEGSTYVLADVYEKYIEVYDAGLMEWEYNTTQMAGRLRGENTTCPQTRSCDLGIRTLQPDGGYYSCGAFGDDGLYPIDFEKEMTGELSRPLQTLELLSLKTSCMECPMFDICNGCKKTTHDLKTLGLVETHCKKMKTLASKIIAINKMSDVLTPTPYIQEYF